ncbi:hypothetical protein [Tolypothrix sp. VBCCA 56010]|uniref:hypothetical protein n=1 Tax=Tolypothrix sp. VBCCA 56010 TaxID=3137731 RepID=UPI003D7D9FEE
MATKTIFDAYSAYSAIPEYKNQSSVLISTIGRYLISVWGGQAPLGDRTTPRERIAIEDFLKTLPITLLIDSVKVLSQAFEAKKISKANSKSYKSAYKSFVDWTQNNGYLKAESTGKTAASETKSTLFKRQQKGSGRKKKGNYHGKHHKQAYALMARYSNSNVMSGELIYPTDYINEDLAKELKTFKFFRCQNHNCSEATIIKDMARIYQILGWLHRYKGLPLEQLSLKSIINFIQLNIPKEKATNSKGKYNQSKHMLEKASAREDAVDLANKNRNLIQEYLNFVGGHPRTQAITLATYIAVAKFVFRNELGTDDYIDETELPIMRRLNQLSKILSKDAKSTPPSVAHADKSIPWEEAINLLELCRQKADATKDYYGKIRNKNAIVNNLQTFLSLAFMLLIPVDRARTYYELKIGETFVYGIHEGGRFTPVSKMQDPSAATWYIHLMPGDYKTGKIYGEYWGIMPNVRFSDGQKLYKYIDRWLNEGREYKQKCNHNFFFRGSIKYEGLNAGDWRGRIKQVFAQETGIPVTPKELRKMYVTYLNNKQATNAELKGAAKAMHHSPNMQERIYNSQNILDSIAPAYDFNERMHKKAFTPPV